MARNETIRILKEKGILSKNPTWDMEKIDMSKIKPIEEIREMLSTIPENALQEAIMEERGYGKYKLEE